jgi:hypothetical protein
MTEDESPRNGSRAEMIGQEEVDRFHPTHLLAQGDALVPIS